MDNPPRVSRLQHLFGNQFVLMTWCVVASFGTYACMYGFRKPFTAATYTTEPFADGMKVLFVTAQVVGYMISKFIGIKVVAEMEPERRARTLLLLIGIAQLALLLFALVPPPYSAACLFLNGLPLGMVFGLVLGFLEGRQLTEAFVAGLCASFILADGVVKTVGASLLTAGVPERWMPAAAGMVFVLPLIAFVWMLAKIPPPTTADVDARSMRSPMNRRLRMEWMRKHGVALLLIVLAYLLITVLRSLRADFAPEIWRELGIREQPDVFARSEFLVALGVTLTSGLVVFVKNNRRALITAVTIGIIGLALMAVSTGLQTAGSLGAFPFMVLVGLGLYLPYVVVHTTIFERLIALTRDPGNIGFLMYVADAFGYLGYVGVMFGKRWIPTEMGYLQLFKQLALGVSIVAALAFIGALLFLLLRSARTGRDRTAALKSTAAKNA